MILESAHPQLFLNSQFPMSFFVLHVCKQDHIQPKFSHPRPHSRLLCAFRNNKRSPGLEDAEDKCENIITIENGVPCDPLDTKGGHVNDGFLAEDERLTPL